MVCTLMKVKFPSMRAEVVLALASLADSSYQSSGWFSGRQIDGLSSVIHTLYDDMAGFPDPQSRIGTVFVKGEEISRICDLERVLTPLIDEYSLSSDIGRDTRWAKVVELAGRSLFQMVRNGI